jgi:hypothetical protein
MLLPLLGEIVLLLGKQLGGRVEIADRHQILQMIPLIEERRVEILRNPARLTGVHDRAAAPIRLASRQGTPRKKQGGSK